MNGIYLTYSLLFVKQMQGMNGHFW